MGLAIVNLRVNNPLGRIVVDAKVAEQILRRVAPSLGYRIIVCRREITQRSEGVYAVNVELVVEVV